jgi:hypothetical protein
MGQLREMRIIEKKDQHSNYILGGGAVLARCFARSAVGYSPQGRVAREAKPFYILSYSSWDTFEIQKP